MGLMDKLKKNADKAKGLAEKNADKIADGVGKATGYVDDKTKGKYSDKLNKVDGAAKDFAEKANKPDTGAVDPGPGDQTGDDDPTD